MEIFLCGLVICKFFVSQIGLKKDSTLLYVYQNYRLRDYAMTDGRI